MNTDYKNLLSKYTDELNNLKVQKASITQQIESISTALGLANDDTLKVKAEELKESLTKAIADYESKLSELIAKYDELSGRE